jgi:hypothetical protein
MDRRSEQQIYRRVRVFLFGKPFNWENYRINFSCIVSFQKLRQMQEAFSGDNISHLQI